MQVKTLLPQQQQVEAAYSRLLEQLAGARAAEAESERSRSALVAAARAAAAELEAAAPAALATRPEHSALSQQQLLELSNARLRTARARVDSELQHGDHVQLRAAICELLRAAAALREKHNHYAEHVCVLTQQKLASFERTFEQSHTPPRAPAAGAKDKRKGQNAKK